jgi:hypothetical protein
MLPPLPNLSSPGASTVSDELAPVFTPMKLALEPDGSPKAASVMLATLGGEASLKFLLPGLIGCTQAWTGPFNEGEQLF